MGKQNMWLPILETFQSTFHKTINLHLFVLANHTKVNCYLETNPTNNFLILQRQ